MSGSHLNNFIARTNVTAGTGAIVQITIVNAIKRAQAGYSVATCNV